MSMAAPQRVPRRDRWAGLSSRARDDMIADALDDHDIRLDQLTAKFDRAVGRLTAAVITMATTAILIAVELVTRLAG